MQLIQPGLLGDIGDSLSHNMYAYTANNPVMYIDLNGYFMVGVMIASIFISVIFEVYEDIHEDGDFDIGWNYVGAVVSGWFSALGSRWTSVLYSFIGSSLDYFISGNFNSETLGQDLFFIGISSFIGYEIGKSLKFGVSKLKAASLFKLNNNSLANSLLSKMGLSTNIGSNAAKANLSGILYRSSKYFFGEIIKNIGSNVTNNGLLLLFD